MLPSDCSSWGQYRSEQFSEIDRNIIRKRKGTHLQGHDDILNVKAAILSEGLGNDQQGVREGLYSHLDPSLCGPLDGSTEMRGTCNLERTCTRDQGLVFDCILDGTKSVTKRILNLLDRVPVGTLDQKRDTLGILDVLEEREPLLAEGVLIDETSPAENVRCEVINGVLCYASTNELQPVIN